MFRRSRRGEVGQDTVSCGTVRRSRFVSVWSNLVGHGGARRLRRGPIRQDGLRYG